MIDLTLSYFVAPHVLSKMQYIPEPTDYVTHKDRIMGLLDAVFIAGAADPADPTPPADMPHSLFSRCSEFIRECNDYFRQLDRHRALLAADDMRPPIAVLPALSLNAQLTMHAAAATTASAAATAAADNYDE